MKIRRQSGLPSNAPYAGDDELVYDAQTGVLHGHVRGDVFPVGGAKVYAAYVAVDGGVDSTFVYRDDFGDVTLGYDGVNNRLEVSSVAEDFGSALAVYIAVTPFGGQSLNVMGGGGSAKIQPIDSTSSPFAMYLEVRKYAGEYVLQ